MDPENKDQEKMKTTNTMNNIQRVLLLIKEAFHKIYKQSEKKIKNEKNQIKLYWRQRNEACKKQSKINQAVMEIPGT